MLLLHLHWMFKNKAAKLLFVGYLTSQKHASVSHERICSDDTCCCTEIEGVDQTCYLTQARYTGAGLTSPNTDPMTLDTWQDSHWSNNNNNSRIQRRYSRFFYNLLTAPRTVSNTYAQVARAQSCANHEQHIERLSSARAMLCATWYEGTAQLLSLAVEIAFI